MCFPPRSPSEALDELSQFMFCSTHSPLTEKDITSNTENRCFPFGRGEQTLCELELEFFLPNPQIFQGCCSLTVFLCVPLSLFLSSVLWLVYINIKAFIEVHLLSNITYIHLQVHPTLSRLSQRLRPSL